MSCESAARAFLRATVFQIAPVEYCSVRFSIGEELVFAGPILLFQFSEAPKGIGDRISQGFEKNQLIQ